MTTIFLSPSDQTGNKYAVGNTNEAEQCRRIANAVERRLNEYAEVRVINDQTNNMAGRVKHSNSVKADAHIPIHTNATTNGTNDGKVSGTRGFYYNEKSKGKAIAKAIVNAIGPLTPGYDKISAYPSLYEIKGAVAPCAYIEVEFHDNPKQSQWIIDNANKIGINIADALARYFNLKLKAPSKRVYTVEVSKSLFDEVHIKLV